MVKINLKSILSQMDFKYAVEEENQTSKVINGVASLDNAGENDFSFCSGVGPEAIRSILESRAGAVLCQSSLRGMLFTKNESNKLLIFVDNPRLAFIQILKYINTGKLMKGISQTAVISKTAEIGSNCFIGNYTTIGDHCKIGNNTIIYDRVSILQNTVIGKNCIIQPGVIIGADGFAFERRKISLRLERFPHIGGVIIGDNVELCTNCTIARGSISNTIIGNGTKLDSMVHIAHNVKIGENCVLTAGSIVGGGTTIGDTCWAGLNCTLKHKIKIGNKVIIGCGASVINNVQDEDVVAGVPAKSIKHKVTTDKLFLMAGQKARKGIKKEVLEKLQHFGYVIVTLSLLVDTSDALNLF